MPAAAGSVTDDALSSSCDRTTTTTTKMTTTDHRTTENSRTAPAEFADGAEVAAINGGANGQRQQRRRRRGRGGAACPTGPPEFVAATNDIRCPRCRHHSGGGGSTPGGRGAVDDDDLDVVQEGGDEAGSPFSPSWSPCTSPYDDEKGQHPPPPQSSSPFSCASWDDEDGEQNPQPPASTPSSSPPCPRLSPSSSGSTVYATDPSVFPIPGLFLRDDFLAVEEEERVLRILDDDDYDDDDCDDGDDELGECRRPPRWKNTGFSSTDSRRRQIHVRRADCDRDGDGDGDGVSGTGEGGEAEASAPPLQPSPFESRWGWLLDRLLLPSPSLSPPSSYDPPPPLPLRCPCGRSDDDVELPQTNRRRWRYVDRIEIVAEEYRGASRPSASMFEDRHPHRHHHHHHHHHHHQSSHSRPCRCNCHCRVASVVELSLGNHAVLSLQKPRRRSNDEWKLLAGTKVLVKRRSALVRSGEFLDDWRSHVSCRGQHPSVVGTDDGGGGGEGGERGAGGGGIELPEGMGRLVRDGSYRRVALKIRFFQNGDDCSCARARGEEVVESESRRSSPTVAAPPCVARGGIGGGGGGDPSEASDANVVSSSTTSPLSSSSPSPTPPPIPPLRELLTVVVTTSPIKSNPSTELLERTFSTFHLAGHDFAHTCRKVIVCDGLRLLDDEGDGGGAEPEAEDGGKKEEEAEAAGRTRHRHHRRRGRHNGVSRKYANAKQSLRNGIATREQAEKYNGFKAALRDLCSRADAEAGAEDAAAASASEGVNDGVETTPSPSSPLAAFRNAVVVELAERHGYGFALREALRHHVTTPYVCVIQHDRTFMRPTPVEEVVLAMRGSGVGSDCGGAAAEDVVTAGDGSEGSAHGGAASAAAKIRYVGMSMRSNLLYRDIFLSKYGKAAHRELESMVLRPRELRLSSALYDRDGSGPRDMMSSVSSRKLRENLRSLSSTYFASETYSCHKKWVDEHADGDDGDHDNDGLAQLTLTPTLFWYDNTHVAETAHYRDFVFNPRYRHVARGGFVEDKLSPVLLRQVERLGLREAHSNFGCYLLDDHSGTFFTGHLDGGSYVTEGERCAMIAAMAASGRDMGGSS